MAGRRRGTISVLASLCAETDPPTAHAKSQEPIWLGGALASAGSALPGPPPRAYARVGSSVFGDQAVRQTRAGRVEGSVPFFWVARSAGARWARRGCSCLRMRSARAASPHPTRRIAVRSRRWVVTGQGLRLLLRCRHHVTPHRGARRSASSRWRQQQQLKLAQGRDSGASADCRQLGPEPPGRHHPSAAPHGDLSCWVRGGCSGRAQAKA